MGNFSKNIAVWIVISLILIALFNVFEGNSERENGNVIAYSDFLQRIENGEIKEVNIDGDKVSGSTSDGRPFFSFIPKETELANELSSKGINDSSINDPVEMLGFPLAKIATLHRPSLLLTNIV